MKTICSICARGGSKGVPGKNVRVINGKPLIAHSIDQAQKAGIFDCIVVSSDSDEILDISNSCGVDICVKRPPSLATDEAGKLDAIRHCLLEVESQLGETFDFCFDLDATSPLRIVEDICNVWSIICTKEVENVITATPSRRSPYFNVVELDDFGVPRLCKEADNEVKRRQDAPLTYDMNASIYAWAREALMTQKSLFGPNTRLYLMPQERSYDIDEELDFVFVEFMMAQMKTD